MIIFSATSKHVNESNHFEYHFDLEIEKDSPDAVLLSYLMDDDSQDYSQEEMMLSALRAYWMPIAYEFYRTESNYSIRDSQLRRMARNAINHLRERAEMINHHFCANLTHAPIPPFDRADRMYLLSPRPIVGREPKPRR
jgi:hypothetical protein